MLETTLSFRRLFLQLEVLCDLVGDIRPVHDLLSDAAVDAPDGLVEDGIVHGEEVVFELHTGLVWVDVEHLQYELNRDRSLLVEVEESVVGVLAVTQRQAREAQARIEYKLFPKLILFYETLTTGYRLKQGLLDVLLKHLTEEEVASVDNLQLQPVAAVEGAGSRMDAPAGRVEDGAPGVGKDSAQSAAGAAEAPKTEVGEEEEEKEEEEWELSKEYPVDSVVVTATVLVYASYSSSSSSGAPDEPAPEKVLFHSITFQGCLSEHAETNWKIVDLH